MTAPEGPTVNQPTAPEVIVWITRYTVSVLPAADINHKFFALYVELQRDGWTIGDGHVYYAEDGTWQPSGWKAQRFADYDDALVLARQLAVAAGGQP